MRKPTTLHPAEHYQTVFWHEPAVGTEFQDLLKTEYWTHVARQMRPFTVVKIVPEDLSYYAELLVTAVGPLSASMQVLREPLKITANQATGDNEFEIKWVSPTRKFGVVRKSDGSMLKDGFETKERADTWRRDHSKVMAA